MSRTRATLLAEMRERFQRAGIDAASAAAEAELILLHALSMSRAEFWCEPGAPLTPAELERAEALAVRRERRVPIQQILGSVGFHDVTLFVEPGVFVPRPETESLVEAVLERLRGIGAPAATGAAAAAPASGRLLDLGTGTGAIAVALLHALPGWTGVAVDRSPAARTLAARNAEANGVGARLTVVAGDCFAPVPAGGAAGAALPADLLPTGLPPGPYDLVVSNPPYIPTGEIARLMPEVRDHDPREALDGGAEGLDAYRAIARLLPGLLRDGGLLALEFGDDQADALLGLPEWEGMMGPRLEAPLVRHDLAGRQRVVVATWRGGGHEAANRNRHRAGREDRAQADG
ncbi:MAG TPA: peptide chain release factor N(5)-glutamine methyltransferase [Candidatus Eisenbacteria bacterium]|nr:peptide chain release factor N(5)-glutamine methyltransferase [Candidatus Eisenbacteria bacterium]